MLKINGSDGEHLVAVDFQGDYAKVLYKLEGLMQNVMFPRNIVEALLGYGEAEKKLVDEQIAELKDLVALHEDELQQLHIDERMLDTELAEHGFLSGRVVDRTLTALTALAALRRARSNMSEAAVSRLEAQNAVMRAMIDAAIG